VAVVGTGLYGLSSIIQTKLLRAICACVLLGILVAGLWPFHAPRNEVSWFSEGNGLLFGKHGSIVSASPFKAHASQGDSSCSLEIWLEPSRIDSGGMILAFYWLESRVVPFALRQWRTGLVLEPESQGHFPEKAELYVGDVFSRLKPVLVTITSGEAGTATYVDGILVKRVPNFAISSRDLTGQLVVGNAPATTYNWSGQVKGLAVYDRELSAAEVSQGFVDWTKGSQLDSAKSEGVIARYLFDEGRGNVVHNQVDSATDLFIPERFFVLHEQFLELPWDEFHSGWHYWKNIGINIAGFIPLGFFFCAYLSSVGESKRAVMVTIAAGFVTSFAIEVLQAFLPTRDSGMTDLITNTLGTAVGVMAFRYKAVQAVLAARPTPLSQRSVSSPQPIRDSVALPGPPPR
jgi:VanZ like family/Concanavalin A-like lectin/glucanases superfamily